MPNFTITSSAGKNFGSYLALPDNVSADNPAPCVIVIQEIFGVNEGIRKKCDWLAQEGFIACAPDLFHQFSAGIELSDQNPAELQQAFDYFPKFDIGRGINDIEATLIALQSHELSNGKVGALGYCLGGQLAYLASYIRGIKASVGYYGVGIEHLLVDANEINARLMLHIAQKDEFVSTTAQTMIFSALDDHPYITLHSYPDVGHAFSREGGDHYDESSAKMADMRSIAFLNSHLKNKRA